MTRRNWMVLLPALAGCRRPPRPLEELLPAAPGEGWTRSESSAVPVEAAPELVRRLGLRRALRASYQGPGELRVVLYEMTTSAGAFELLQKWRPGENSVPFHKDRYFLVVESDRLDRPALLRFVRLIEGAIGPPR